MHKEVCIKPALESQEIDTVRLAKKALNCSFGMNTQYSSFPVLKGMAPAFITGRGNPV